MTRILKAILVGAAALTIIPPAVAQSYRDSSGTVVPGVVPIKPGVGPLFTPTNPGVISGSFAATISGFQPTPAYSQLSASTSSSRVALPSGTVVVVYNSGSNPVFVQLGGSSVAATTGNDIIQPNSWMAFTVGSATYIAGVTSAGSTAVNISGGSGLPTGAGAGGGSGGGSSAIASWAGGALGAMANYGTAPGAILVPGVNAYVTNAVTTTPKAGTFAIAGCTVGTSSAQCLAAGTYNHVQIQNASASNAIACSWGGTAALNGSNSVQLAAGQAALWGPNTAGAPSGVALNCIASAASTPLYVESN